MTYKVINAMKNRKEKGDARDGRVVVANLSKVVTDSLFEKSDLNKDLKFRRELPKKIPGR